MSDAKVAQRSPYDRHPESVATSMHSVATSVQESVTNTSMGVSASLYVSDFTRLARPTPFRINVHGIVSNVAREVISRNDNHMKAFTVQDANGMWVRCLALGHHVDNPALVQGNEVVVFFITALGGLGRRSGQLWLYDDAHIMRTRKNCVLRRAREEIVLH